MPRFKARVRDVGGISLVDIAGAVDEDNALPELTEQVRSANVMIRLADVQRINSLGVRDWVKWIGQLEQKGCSLYYLECSPAIITQVNLVSNFVGHGTIVSFYAPYFLSPCARDGAHDCERMRLIKTEDALHPRPFVAPTFRCDQCDHLMAFDEVESSYFSFLAHIERVDLPEDIRLALDKFVLMGLTNLSKTASGQDGSSSDEVSGSGRMSDGAWTPTVPGESQLGGLLSDHESAVGSSGHGSAQRPVGVNVLLYVITGLLAVAVALLAYVVLR